MCGSQPRRSAQGYAAFLASDMWVRAAFAAVCCCLLLVQAGVRAQPPMGRGDAPTGQVSEDRFPDDEKASSRSLSGEEGLPAAGAQSGENQLPGKKTSPGQKALPGENELPGEIPDEARLPGAQRPKLPSENALPSSQRDRAAVLAALPAETELPGDKPAEPQKEERQPPNRPWLRLALPGHTGTVRALAFAADGRLCSAGDDKEVEVWARAEGGPADGRWSHERTIRWQVQRGPRGRIYALASGGGLLALAGHGAMGGLGEIALVDPATGELKQTLVDLEKGHRQVVASLAIAPGNKPRQLFSMDVAGTLVEWIVDPKTGAWRARRLLEPDTRHYGEATARALEPWRRLTPFALAGRDRLVVPVLAEDLAAGGRPTWKLRLLSLAGGEPRDLSAAHHFGMVTALAASADGTRIASADYFGNVLLWRLGAREDFVRLRLDGSDVARRAVTALAFNPAGTKLVIGTARTRDGGSARVQVWDVNRTGRPAESLPVSDDVYSVAVSKDGRRLAWPQGSDVVVADFGRLADSRQVLKAPLAGVTRVAFAMEEPFYRIALDRGRGAGPVFDAHRGRLEDDRQLKPQDWIGNEVWKGDWELDRKRRVLLENGRQRGRIPLTAELDGDCTAVCWIPDRNRKPVAVAIGTDGRNNIYVFALAREGTCPLVRQFRGHQSAVTSLGVSRDLRCLASSSRDGTVMCWSLRDRDVSTASLDRWGLELSADGGKLTVASVREDGPTYARGMRAGDIITEIQWATSPDETQTRRTPEEILKTLEQLDFRSLVLFRYRRGALEQEPFQVFPAWQPIASLLVADDRQWAWWTPAGYYDASFNGHKLFGWQVNRGLDMPPEFILAAQLRKTLEKPDVMRRLLPQGSLEGAFRAAHAEMPAGEHRVLTAQAELAPRIRMLEPAEGQLVAGPTAHLRAEITVAGGQQLVPPKAFANGVFAGPPRLVEEHSDEMLTTRLYEWDAPLPSDREVVLQVAASTESESAALGSTRIRHSAATHRRPQLFVLTAGVSNYRDSQIADLDYAARNAQVVADVFASQLGSLYDMQVTTLVDERVNRFLWNIELEEAARRMRSSPSPDDLVIVFLSGHGVRDSQTQEYWFVPAEANYRDLANGRYEDCLSLGDLNALADVPCRKLVILDTCHSGAVQPLESAHLKTAVRNLQQDLILTLTASEGTEEALESPEHGLGRFTYQLVEALRGKADDGPSGGNGDGVVTLSEVIRYVDRKLLETYIPGTPLQHPTAGPSELLDYIELPLTAPGK